MEIRNSSIQMNILRSGSPLSQIAKETVTDLTPGTYKVFIFDWERDGSVASTPSYVGHVNVTGINHEVDTATTSAFPTTTGSLSQYIPKLEIITTTICLVPRF